MHCCREAENSFLFQNGHCHSAAHRVKLALANIGVCMWIEPIMHVQVKNACLNQSLVALLPGEETAWHSALVRSKRISKCPQCKFWLDLTAYDCLSSHSLSQANEYALSLEPAGNHTPIRPILSSFVQRITCR